MTPKPTPAEDLTRLLGILCRAHDALSKLDERMKTDAYYGGNVRPSVVRAIAAIYAVAKNEGKA